MVKLVVVDMDGTFLNDNKEKSPEYKKVINALKDRGVYFCVASGRQLASIKKEMEEVKDGLIFVAENGAVIEMNNEIISVDELDDSILEAILAKEPLLKNKKMICCAKEYTYIKMEDKQDEINAAMYLPSHKVVEDFKNLPEKPVKISIFSKEGYDSDHDMLFDEFSDIASVCTSGFEWLDIISKGTSKGSAVRKLQKILDITKEETMIFGDQMNDFDMLMEAHYSYAMENATDKVKQICRYTAPSNNEFGVIKVLKEHFNID